MIGVAMLSIGCVPSFTQHTAPHAAGPGGAPEGMSGSLAVDAIAPRSGEPAPESALPKKMSIIPNATWRLSGRRNEIALRLPSLAISLKTELAYSRFVSSAINPRAQIYARYENFCFPICLFSRDRVYAASAFDAPLLVGFTPVSNVTLVGIVGLAYTQPFDSGAVGLGWFEAGLALHLHDAGNALSLELLLLEPFRSAPDALPMLNAGLAWMFGYPVRTATPEKKPQFAPI